MGRIEAIKRKRILESHNRLMNPSLITEQDFASLNHPSDYKKGMGKVSHYYGGADGKGSAFDRAQALMTFIENWWEDDKDEVDNFFDAYNTNTLYGMGMFSDMDDDAVASYRRLADTYLKLLSDPKSSYYLTSQNKLTDENGQPIIDPDSYPPNY